MGWFHKQYLLKCKHKDIIIGKIPFVWLFIIPVSRPLSTLQVSVQLFVGDLGISYMAMSPFFSFLSLAPYGVSGLLKSIYSDWWQNATPKCCSCSTCGLSIFVHDAYRSLCPFVSMWLALWRNIAMHVGTEALVVIQISPLEQRSFNRICYLPAIPSLCYLHYTVSPHVGLC